MRWQKGRRSDNVVFNSGGRSGSGKKLGVGGLVIAAIIAFVMKDSTIFFKAVEQEVGAQLSPASQQTTYQPSEQELQWVEFVKVILADTEDVWGKLFAAEGQTYQPPTLVLFSGAVQSACGAASAQSGPFYCPADQQVYLDLTFLNDLKKLGAPGDFAFAYVIAHEVGHHVSNILGTLPRIHQQQRQVSKSQANQLSIQLELQADCYAGVWAYHASQDRQLLEMGDAEEGIQAATSVGDDKLVGDRPDLFTHGTSAQRVQALREGMQQGQIGRCAI